MYQWDNVINCQGLDLLTSQALVAIRRTQRAPLRVRKHPPILIKTGPPPVTVFLIFCWPPFQPLPQICSAGRIVLARICKNTFPIGPIVEPFLFQQFLAAAQSVLCVIRLKLFLVADLVGSIRGCFNLFWYSALVTQRASSILTGSGGRKRLQWLYLRALLAFSKRGCGVYTCVSHAVHSPIVNGVVRLNSALTRWVGPSVFYHKEVSLHDV